VHAVALAEDQLKVELPPLAIVLGLTFMLTVVSGGVTVTVADCVALPPGPLQASVKVVFAVSASVVCEPCSGTPRRQPSEAVQAVALLALQFRVVVLPAGTMLGVALKCTTGAEAVAVTVTACTADPPGPVQVISYSVVFASAPVDCEPFAASAPLQPPEAVHAVALLAVQVSVALPPLTSVVGAAVKVTVGGVAVTTTLAAGVNATVDPELPLC
jgi:hypothetical protein